MRKQSKFVDWMDTALDGWHYGECPYGDNICSVEEPEYCLECWCNNIVEESEEKSC
jgi:hypothetical protein